MHRENVRTGKPKHQSISDARSWLSVAHIFALWAFAVAQPILDLVGREPDFLVAHRLTGAPLAILALGLALVIPTLLATPLAFPAVRRSRAGSLWQHGLCALLAAAFLLQLLHRLPGGVALVLATAGGAGVVFCLRRYRGFSNLVAVAALAALIAPLVFLLRPGVRGLLPTLSETNFEPDAVIAEAPVVKSDLPIVLVVFDELPTSSLQRPDGSIDDRRFPSFAALAEGSDWYRRAVTVAMQTPRAIPALLTGQLPRRDSHAYYREHTSNLFSWLAAKGDYRVIAQETVSQLCPPAICTDRAPQHPWWRLAAATDDLGVVYGHLLLPPALRTRLPDVSYTWTGFRGGGRPNPDVNQDRTAGVGALHQDVPRLVDDFLQRVERGSTRTPTFYYLHLNLPHRPWKYLPSGREYTPVGTSLLPPGFDTPKLPEDEQLIVHGLQRHLLQVGYADRVLGRLISQLKSLEIFDRALVVVVADHGHSFRPGEDRRVATEANVEDVLEVPLFVKRPGQRQGTVVDRVVQTVDIVPTIAAAVGGEPPWEVDGRALHDNSPRDLSACCFPVGDATRRFRSDPARRQQALDRIHRLFGSSAITGTTPLRGTDFDQPRSEREAADEAADATHSPFEGVFAAGPRPVLLGRAAADFTDRSLDDRGAEIGRVVLAGQHSYQNVRPETGFIPSLISGQIEPSPPEGTELAVSVDGIVRATTRTFADRGASRFSALVQERWLTAGSHQIDVYAIEGSGIPPEDSDRTILRPLRGVEPPRILIEAGIVRAVGLPGDVSLQNTNGLFQSDIELVNGGFRGLLVSEPGERLLAVDEFFVFDGPTLLYRGEDDQFLQRIRTRGDGREQMTFRISLPEAVMRRSQSLRLLVRSGDRVQDLYLSPRLPGTFEQSRDDQGHVDALLRRPMDIADAEPERIEVEASHDDLIGFLDGPGPGETGILGWAADLRNPGTSHEIVAFLGEREICVGETGSPRPDVATRHGEKHRYSGFLLLVRPNPGSSRSSELGARDLAVIEREGVVAYAVSRRGIATRLRFSYRPLESKGSAEVLPVSDGRRLIVRPPGDGFGGAVDLVTRSENLTLVEGWAADLERSERPRQIVIYRDGKFLKNLGANRARPDVAAHHDDPRLLRTGFRGVVPGAPEPETFAEHHRVFALMLSGSAVELPIRAAIEPLP